ncbi:MAG: L-rhamnose/proton symporter RhaT [Terriglobia bacterium]
MNDQMWGVGILLVASLLSAAFAIPMRYSRVWKWENTWLVFCILSLIVLPWLLVAFLVTHADELLTSLTFREMAPALAFGFLWGIAQATFGLAIHLLGVSVALPVVGAFTIVLGSATPALIDHPETLTGRLGVRLLLSTVLLVAGLIFYSRAARMREPQTLESKSSRGLLLALITGVLGGAINVGFALSKEIMRHAQSLGNTPTISTYPVWAVLLAAGFLPNAIYCLYLLRRNGSGKLFAAPHISGDFFLSLLMAMAWILATTLYGIATTFLGTQGTSLGYFTYGSLSIFFAGALGWKAGEWKGARRGALRTFWIAMGFILASVGVLSFRR